MKSSKDSLRDLWDIIKWTNICIIGVLEKQQERERSRNLIQKNNY